MSNSSLETLFSLAMASFSYPNAHPRMAVAVSGGADSLALVKLTHQWAQKQGGDATALIVDHKLRPESTKEASQVAQWLIDLGISHHILTWEGDKPTSRIQERARQMRYHLLETWCQEHHISLLLTAHHQDDQWETMMQRINRHSGPVGLQGILPEVHRPFGRILRPLLTMTKAQLIDYLHQEGQDYIQDPSNDNLNYERVRWRQERKDWEEKGYTPSRIEEIRQEALETVRVLEDAFRIWEDKHLRFHELGYLSFPAAEWESLEESFKHYFLKKMILLFPPLSKNPQKNEQVYPLETSICKKIVERLQDPLSKRAMTARGCYFCQHEGMILVTREVRALQKFLAHSSFERNSSSIVWDRFRIDFQDSSPKTIDILGHRRAQEIKAKSKPFTKDIPSYVLASLPVLLEDRDILFLHELAHEAPQRVQIKSIWSNNFTDTNSH